MIRNDLLKEGKVRIFYYISLILFISNFVKKNNRNFETIFSYFST